MNPKKHDSPEWLSSRNRSWFLFSLFVTPIGTFQTIYINVCFVFVNVFIEPELNLIPHLYHLIDGVGMYMLEIKSKPKPAC